MVILRVAEEGAHVLEDWGGVPDEDVALCLTNGLWGIRAEGNHQLVNDLGGLLSVKEAYEW